jgi:putative transposase
LTLFFDATIIGIMARQWRIEFPGALYHVMSRGNNFQNIFLTDDDRHLFYELLGVLAERFAVEIYAYVLMGTHYHLLLKTTEPNLSKAMQWFGTTYTGKFNLNNRTGGHLFQGRFKSIIVQDDVYLLQLSYYIHRNPLRAGIVKRIADYPWSSYHYYAYKKKPPIWLKSENLLDQFPGENSHQTYRIKVQQYSDEIKSIWEEVKYGLIYGGQEFIERIKTNYLGNKKDAELPQRNRLLRSLDIETILKVAAKSMGYDREAARMVKRISPGEKDKRDLLLYWLRQSGCLSNDKIGDYFGLTYSAVSRYAKNMSNRIAKDRQLRFQYEKLKSQIKV